MENFDIKNYYIKFESVFIDDNIKKQYLNYLLEKESINNFITIRK